ncbi:MAG: methyl-accepting chemotaxis protein [Thermodesulfobacteriota bacterium]
MERKGSQLLQLLHDFTVNQRITVGFATVLALFLLCGAVSHFGIGSITDNAEEAIGGVSLDGVLAQKEADHLAWANSVNTFLLDERVEALKVQTDDHQCGLGKWLYGEGRTKAEKLVPTLAPMLKELEAPHQRLHQTAIKIDSLFREADPASGRAAAKTVYLEETVPALTEVQGLFKKIREEAKGQIISDEAMLASARRTKMAGAAITTIAVLVGLAISYSLATGLSKLLGDRTQAIRDSACQVAAAAGEISRGSQLLSDGASEQAAMIEESSSSLAEVSAMSKKTTELTEGSEQLMKENITRSAQSVKSLAELTKTISKIEEESGQIRQIITTIDAIAFQTNLLALNAAVEAARAGEAGAGFAVVAAEVKNLAGRTGEAAHNTQGLLDATVNRITSCAKAVKAINDDFDAIVESATIIGDKNATVTEASRQQARSIAEVSKAIEDSSQTTQQIASTAEESAAASEELSAQSEEMKNVVADLARLVYGPKADLDQLGDGPAARRPGRPAKTPLLLGRG